MILKNTSLEKGTETVSLTLEDLAGAATTLIPEGAKITKVWYEPAVAGDDGGVDITIDGTGTDLVIGSMSATDVSQIAQNVVFEDGWTVGSGQAGVLTAVATGTPTAGSGVLNATFTRSPQS